MSHDFKTLHEVNLNVSFNFPGLMPFLNHLRTDVMGKLEDLQTAVTNATTKLGELKDANADLQTDVATLVTGFADQKAAFIETAAELQALKDQVAQGGSIKDTDLDSPIQSLTDLAASAQNLIDSVKQTDTSVEGATGVQTPPAGDGGTGDTGGSTPPG